MTEYQQTVGRRATRLTDYTARRGRAKMVTMAAMAWVLLLPALAAADDRARAREQVMQAERAAAAGDLATAVRTMEQAEASAPAWAEVKVNLAGLRIRAGDYAGAVHAARAALALDPGLDGARFNLGLAQFRIADYAGAQDTLARYSGDASAPTTVHVVLGLSHSALDQPREAAGALDLVFETGGRDPAVLYALARALTAIGQTERTRVVREALVASAPRSAAAHVLTGDDFDRRGDWVAAEAAYRRAVAADPGFPGVHSSLGVTLYKRRAYDDAEAAFARELQRNPHDAPALYYTAALELDRGHPAAAIPLLARLTALSPRRADAWRELGRAHVAAGHPAKALESLRRATTLDPEDPSAHYQLGLALKKLGNLVAAAESMRIAANLNRKRRQELLEKVTPQPH